MSGGGKLLAHCVAAEAATKRLLVFLWLLTSSICPCVFSVCVCVCGGGVLFFFIQSEQRMKCDFQWEKNLTALV